MNYGSAFFAVVVDTVLGRAEGTSIGSDQFTGVETVNTGAGADRIIAGFEDLVLRGGAGNDIYEFAEEAPTTASGRTVHQIVDFSVGDRVRAKGLEVFVETANDGTGLFDDDHTSLGQIPQINVFYETFEGLDQTALEWEFDDSDASVSVVLVGHHAFGWSAAVHT